MSILLDHKNIADAIKSWLGVITVFTAGAYTVFEYTEHKQSVRVERALGYVEQFRDSSAFDAKLALNQLLVDKQASLNKLLKADYDKPEKLNQAYQQFILSLTGKTETQKNLEIAFSFYEEAAICVERQLCDPEVITSFFLNDAKSLFNSFYPYVCSLRSQWNNKTVYLKLEQFYIKTDKDICEL